MPEGVVLDASALLALLGRERGWERVRDALPSAAISTVNLAEVAGKLIERGVEASQVDSLLDLGLERVPFDESMAFIAAQLKVPAGTRGLSLGDRCCLATAWCLERPALTADVAWSRLAIDGLDVRLVR
jgi:PIN domain nuclease of toxin-antitoxin system